MIRSEKQYRYSLEVLAGLQRARPEMIRLLADRGVACPEKTPYVQAQDIQELEIWDEVRTYNFTKGGKLIFKVGAGMLIGLVAASWLLVTTVIRGIWPEFASGGSVQLAIQIAVTAVLLGVAAIYAIFLKTKREVLAIEEAARDRIQSLLSTTSPRHFDNTPE